MNRKLVALDTEDDSCGNPLLFNFTDDEGNHTFRNREDAWEWLADQSPCMVWACNLEYDLLNLYGEWTTRLLTLQYVSAGLMRATLNEADVVFYDTFRHWAMSVDAMGAYIGLRKMKGYLADKVTQDLIDACQRDTSIVYLFVKRMLAQYEAQELSLKSTLPSMALQLWRKMNPAYCRAVVAYSDSMREALRQGYYGGRVEVFRFGPIAGPIKHYDVNSLYPYVMRKYRYPSLNDWHETRSPDFGREGMARLTVFYPDHKFPALPFRSDTEILFPVGRITGSWTYPEVRQALEDGAHIGKVHWAIEYGDTMKPFDSYVDLCWKNRREAKTPLENIQWKLYMNSLYGKFAQGDELLTIHKDREIIFRRASKWSNVIWSAYVTSYARLELLKWLRLADTVYYTDTDSIFTPNALPTGADLGELKMEGEYASAQFFGNKVYVTEHQYKARGVPVKCRKWESCSRHSCKGGKGNACEDLDSPAKDFIRTGRAIYRRPARLRESRRSLLTFNRWYEQEKNFNAEYTKRKILDNDTKPWTLKDYRAMMDSR